MRALSAAELLAAWEQGSGLPLYQQALLWLARAVPERSWEELAQLSIGQRDAELLELREQLFGPQLSSVAACPACGERLELAFQVQDIRAETVVEGTELTLQKDGWQVQFRLPNSLDLAAVHQARSVGEGRGLLLERCVLSAQRQDKKRPGRLPPAVVEAVTVQMAEADPQAETRLALACPACGHQWSAVFDIAAYLAGEIRHWAQRLLREVHALAYAYGWREADILAMSALRRQAYLEMLGRV